MKKKNTNLNLIIKEVISYECVMCVYIQIYLVYPKNNLASSIKFMLNDDFIK